MPERCASFWAVRVGVAESFFISYIAIVSTRSNGEAHGANYGLRAAMTYLLQRFVVDKAGSIFRDFKLTLLDLLAELPVHARSVSWRINATR